jgi:hypothetical protein
MRDIILLILVGAALIFSLLAYQRVDELADVVYRLDAQSNQQAFQQNRVITLGKQIEDLARSLTGSGRKAAPPSR